MGISHMAIKGMTLTRHALTRSCTKMPNGDLALILERMSLVARRIARELAVASLGGELGYTEQINVQGEKVKKLDAWANEVFLQAFAHAHPVCTLVSEEMAEACHEPENCRERSYAILFDPIDGSSNTDVNGSLGTIFSVRRRARRHSTGVDDILRPGSEQVAAGYIIYGPGVQLVYTAGEGVFIFTLDRSLGEFLLWRKDVKMPPRGAFYGVNQGNIAKFHPGARKFVEHITSRRDAMTSYALRYTGAFVADFHRCLLEGGLYLYPGEVDGDGRSKGKLRLMYELAPLSMVAEQAGGRGSNGKGRLMEVMPQSLHDRQPVYIGSAAEIELAEKMQVEG